MAFNFQNLDEATRSMMLQEVDADISNHSLYMSKRFNTQGAALYPQLLREAVQSHSETWLADQLRRQGCFSSHETTQRGVKAVPVTAAETLADGEFNKFYMRGLCARAAQEGISEVVVYRAKDVAHPRTESQMMIGRSVSASKLLTDLRSSPGVDTALGLPPGPNSGLSIKLP